VGITVAAYATFEIGSDEMKMWKKWSIILRKEGRYKMYQYGFRTWWPVKRLKNPTKIRRNITNSAPTLRLLEAKMGG